MLIDLPQVTTARAAHIVGIGYEGLRNYLKAGLLGRVGMLAPFYAADAEAKFDPAPRARWTRFGYADLCLMRTFKLLLDHGFSFKTADSIVTAAGRESLWSLLAHDTEPTTRFLLAWAPYGDNVIYDAASLHHLPNDLLRLGSEHPYTLVDLKAVQAHVVAQLSETGGGPAEPVASAAEGKGAINETNAPP